MIGRASLRPTEHRQYVTQRLGTSQYCCPLPNRSSTMLDKPTMARRYGLLRDRTSLLIIASGANRRWTHWLDLPVKADLLDSAPIGAWHERNLIQLQNGVHASLFLLAAAAFWFGCSNVHVRSQSSPC